MAESNSDNPYQPPESDDVLKPTPRMTAGAVVLGVILGVTLFVSTCVGSSFLAVISSYGTPYVGWLLYATWFGSAVIAVLGTIWYRRRLQRKAQEDQDRPHSIKRETEQ